MLIVFAGSIQPSYVEGEVFVTTIFDTHTGEVQRNTVVVVHLRNVCSLDTGIIRLHIFIRI